MLKELFGGKTPEQVLLYLHNYDEGYGKGIADTYGVALSAVQKQLQKFEDSGLLVSRLVGRSRVYTWNPRSPFVEPLRALLAQRLKLTPKEEIKAYYRQRRRPRKQGKPIENPRKLVDC
jgi:DNA-binding transcriptional ArsR family regulator